MPELPVYIPPKYDELLVSWLWRLADANGLSVREFTNGFLLRKNNRHLGSLPNDCQIDLSVFIPFVLSHITLQDILLNHTEYPAVAPFMSSARQSQMLLSTFGNPFTKSLNHKIITLRICPACQADDPYIRRSHCLPGVKVCWLHNTPLADADTTDVDLDYATYCHDWIELGADYDVIALRKNLGLSYVSDYISFEAGIRKLMAYYPHVIDIPKRDSLIPLTLPEGYSAIYRSNNLNIISHDNCGFQFGMNTSGLLSGWLCPVCQKSMNDEDRFKNFLTTAKNDSYKLITPYNSKLVGLQHICGKTLQVKPSKFILGRKCECEYEKGEATRKNRLKELTGDEFEYIGYSDEIITLRHKQCGETFSMTWSKFQLRPYCKKCKPRFIRTEALVAAEVKEINPEFEYVGGFSQSHNFFRVRHIPCGTITTRRLYEFKKSCFCSKCVKQNATPEELIKRKMDHKYIHIYQKVKAIYSDNEIIFLDDIAKIANTSAYLAKSIMSSIRRNELLEPLPGALGAFRFPGACFSTDEIIRQRYLYHKRVIGYLYGQSFGASIGVCNEPEFPSIATVKEAKPTGRLTKYAGQKLRLKAVPAQMTQDNWQEYQLADLIGSGRKFYPQTEKNWQIIAEYAEKNGIDMTHVLEICSGQANAKTFIRWFQTGKKGKENA